MCLAIPGRVVSVDASRPDLPVARVDFGGVIKDVQLLYTPEVGVGNYVVVHAGYATDVIPEDEALAAIELAGRPLPVAEPNAPPGRTSVRDGDP